MYPYQHLEEGEFCGLGVMIGENMTNFSGIASLWMAALVSFLITR